MTTEADKDTSDLVETLKGCRPDEAVPAMRKAATKIEFLTAQNEAYDKELKLLAKTARAHNMWEFDRLISEVRKRISNLQEKDE